MSLKDPCSHNAFDAYAALATTLTDLRQIRSVIRRRKSDWEHAEGKVKCRDGSEWEISEAEMLAFEKELLDPIDRLRAEQFAHREHRFALDEELSSVLEELFAEKVDESSFPTEVLAQVRESVVGKLTAYLPDPAPEPVDDELQWPVEPEPLELQYEKYEDTLLRD